MKTQRRFCLGILILSLAGTAQAVETAAQDVRKDFVVTLPMEKRPLPEPLPAGTQPGFKFRGVKGWAWTPEQYLAEIPYLVQFKMNFLMNCYTSLWDVEIKNYDDFWTKCAENKPNRWWEDLPAGKKQGMEKVVRACQASGIEFCFAMNPNLYSTRTVNDGSPETVDLLWKHYAWMQSLDVKWFSLLVDDATEGIDASSQSKIANEIFRRLRAKDPLAQFIFCPTNYCGDGTCENRPPNEPGAGLTPANEASRKYQSYLEGLARELNSEIYCIWTGDYVVGKITRQAAEGYRARIGHRLLLFDNYPVNDANPTLHLGPVTDRDLDICEVVDGYMSNAHNTQNEINRVPLATCADYAYNPAAYDPARSIGQSILHLAKTQPEQEVLKDLVEAYPGFLIYGTPDTSLNPVLLQYKRIADAPHSHLAARVYLDFLRQLSSRLTRTFPDSYAAEKKTLSINIAFLTERFDAQYNRD